jgi:hypothetical protein
VEYCFIIVMEVLLTVGEERIYVHCTTSLAESLVDCKRFELGDDVIAAIPEKGRKILICCRCYRAATSQHFRNKLHQTCTPRNRNTIEQVLSGCGDAKYWRLRSLWQGRPIDILFFARLAEARELLRSDVDGVYLTVKPFSILRGWWPGDDASTSSVAAAFSRCFISESSTQDLIYGVLSLDGN